MTQSASDPNQQALSPTKADKRLVAFHWLRPAAVILLGLLVANCASNPTKTASGNKYGVKASPKVIADGQPIPKGGGYDMVGKPYTVAGKLYVPREDKNYSATGMASWYGPSFHGRMTANGEVFDRESVSVAHPTLPLPSYVRVTNTLNGHSIIARVNDRGPYHDDRVVDVSEQVATSLNFKHLGTARVRVDYIGRAPIEGEDDKILLATLRTDGRPAQLGRQQPPTQVASVTPFVPQQANEPAKSTGVTQSKTEPAKTEPAKTDPSKTAVIKAEPAKAAPVAPVAVKGPSVAHAPAPMPAQIPFKPGLPAAKGQPPAPVAAKAQTGKPVSAPQTAAKLPPVPSPAVKTAAVMTKPVPAKAETAKAPAAKAPATKTPAAKAPETKTPAGKAPATAQTKKPPAKPHPQTA